MNFSGKNVLITGASSGIGYELAKQFSAENCNLALLARRKNIIDDLAANLESPDKKVITFKCDVRNKKEVGETFNQVKNIFKNIDVAILNSGVSYRIDIDNFDLTKIEETINTNLFGLIYCIDNLLPDLKKNNNGMIVGISSLAGVRGFPRSAAYCASKSAVTKFLESLRIELRKYKIKVITVKPGFIKTAMTEKNEFKMPFLMNLRGAAKTIIDGIKKEKKIIEFPLPTVLGAKFLGILPASVFDFLLSKNLPKK